MRLPVALTWLALLSGSLAFAQQPLVVDDFEGGVGLWYAVYGDRDKGAPSPVSMAASPDARCGEASARLQFVAGTPWGHMQLGVDPGAWLQAGCDRLALWVRGDGSGETLNLMFGNYEHKPALCYRYPLTLDFTDWRYLEIPFARFEPEGLPANLNAIKLIQLNVGGNKRAVDVRLDEILVLPAAPHGGGHFYDYDAVTVNGWELRAPAEPVVVDPLSGVAPGTVLPRLLHGVRNHADLHNPVSFSLDYGEPGSFGVNVASTSGYGGSALIISLDGQEALHKQFPGETETTLLQYGGYYSVPVPAGKHVIRVDNDGADWTTVTSYRFGNYCRVKVWADRATSAVRAAALDAQAHPLPGVQAEARVIGRPLLMAPGPDGVLTTAPLRGLYPAGRYPVTVALRYEGRVIHTGTVTVPIAATQVRPRQTAFPADKPVRLSVLVGRASGLPLAQEQLAARVADLQRGGERPVTLAAATDGYLAADLGKLAPGRYEVSLQVPATTAGAPPRAHRFRFLVYEAAGREIAREGVIKLRRDGRFLTADGGQYLPWGFATIGIFGPTVETVTRPAGPTNWADASDEDLRNWIGLLKAWGVNVVRFGVNVGGMRADQGGALQPRMAVALKHFLEVLEPLGVRALPVMWWGHYRNFDFQGIKAYDDLVKTQADWFTSPRALALQQEYVRQVVAPYAGDPRIFAWEVMNETYAAGQDRAAAIRWTNEIARAIREKDTTHLVTTSAAEATPAEELEWITGAQVDFFNWHAYPTYPDYGGYRSQAGSDSPREIGTYAALMQLADATAGRPIILGETGNDRGTEIDYPEYKTLITRDCLWLAFLYGSFGGISWDAIADPREFAALSDVAAGFDWRSFQPLPADVTISAPDMRRDLGALARYVWWSLQHGLRLQFAPPSGAAGPASSPLSAPAASFAPPAQLPARVTCSPGYQAAYLAGRSGDCLVYVRNAGPVLPQNVRTREPVDLTVRLAVGKGRLQVIDLDERTTVRSQPHSGDSTLKLGTTDHDYALVVRAVR